MRVIRVYPLFFLVLALVIILPVKVHASIPIFDRSVETDCAATPCQSASVSTAAGDTIMVDDPCYSSSQSIGVGAISDTLSTTFTIVNQITVQQSGATSLTVFSGTSSGGSDKVTLNCSSGFSPQFAFSVDIYSFVTGIGVTNKNFGTVGSGTSSDTLTMTIQPNSFIFEGFTVADSNSACPTNSAGSGQNVRDTLGCGAAGGNRINGLTLDRQFTNGGSSSSTASWTVVAGSTTFTHVTVELLAIGGSVTQVSNCYGNCGSPAVTRTNTNSTKGINFNVSQTWFYENQILFPALIINETASVACTYGTAQCPNSNSLFIGIWVTQTNCFGAVPFTATCQGQLVASGGTLNPVKGLFTIPVNYNVFTGQWIAIGFSATRNGMQLNDTNTAVAIFNQQGNGPPILNTAVAQGTSKANVYAWATGNTITGGAIVPTPLANGACGTDFVCWEFQSVQGLTPNNLILGAIFFAFIYSMFSTVILAFITERVGVGLPGGVYIFPWLGWFTFFAVLVGAIWFVIFEILAVVLMFTVFFSSLAQGNFRHSGRGRSDA